MRNQVVLGNIFIGHDYKKSMINCGAILSELKKLRVFSKVNFVFIYGSHAREKNTPLSDVDLCVSLSLRATERLKVRMKLMGRLSEKYDVTIFEDLPVYVKVEVLSGKIIYCKNVKKTIITALKVIEEYDEVRRIYEYYVAGGRGVEI